MANKKKYFKKRSNAMKALKERKQAGEVCIGVYKMLKGTRHHGEYAVCSYMEWLNTY